MEGDKVASLLSAGQRVVKKKREEETSVGTGHKLFCGSVAFEESVLCLGCDKWA